MASRDYPGWLDHVRDEVIAAGLPPEEGERVSDFMDRFGFDDLDDCIAFVRFYFY